MVSVSEALNPIKPISIAPDLQGHFLLQLVLANKVTMQKQMDKSDILDNIL
ncbi:MAG: hypothetical protein HOP10_15980 [Chitinophagaceae bacterium]|nr:hypothetical protein [Chitinophagaceae bacterium]